MGGYIGARSGIISATVANVPTVNAQDITATDTTPEVTIVNSTHEDTDGGREGKVIFKGQQSGGEETTLAEIQSSHDGTADDQKGDLIFRTNDGSDGTSPTERLRIDSDGIATFSHDVKLPDSGKVTLGAGDDLQIYHNGTNNIIDSNTGNLEITSDAFYVNNAANNEVLIKALNGNAVSLYHDNSKKLETTSSGATITGTTTSGFVTVATSDSVVSGFGNCLLTLDGTGGSGTGDAGVLMKTPSNTRGFAMDHSDGNTFRVFGGNGFGHSSDFRISNVGNVTIGGSLSKGSGSFKIRHPLDSKKDTHWLVHSFVEGPQADNIYRGKVALVDGTATQNIDTVAGMSEGTFDALNREVQCFTTNETGWTAIKGSVSGNVLTITAQENTCTDTISWMVIGERKDEHMMSKHTKWTDSDGKIIIEPELTDTEKEDKTEYLEGIGE